MEMTNLSPCFYRDPPIRNQARYSILFLLCHNVIVYATVVFSFYLVHLFSDDIHVIISGFYTLYYYLIAT